jgi:hypothetical protein
VNQNKNIEEYNMLKLSLEAGIEELERRIEHTHQVPKQDFLLQTNKNSPSLMIYCDCIVNGA